MKDEEEEEERGILEETMSSMSWVLVVEVLESPSLVVHVAADVDGKEQAVQEVPAALQRRNYTVPSPLGHLSA